MRDLATIIRDNDRAVEQFRAKQRVEDNHNRQSSYIGDVHQGVVLHSARHRNTVFLRPGKAAASFLAAALATRDENALIESYF